MIKSEHPFIWSIAVPIALVLATSGCATKKFVRQQVAPVNQKVAKLETQTNDKIAAVWHKQESDISQVNERIATTDQKVDQVASAAQQAQGTASRAMEESQSNSTKITELGDGVAKALNYQQIEKADVMFGFNKSTLTPEAKLALDQAASKCLSLPRCVIELAGFTDTRGTKSYNLALSRRRAEAVQRYLVMQKVPLRSIHIVGMGKEPAPPGLEAEVAAVTGPPSRAEKYRLARRVQVRIFGAGDITAGTASRSEPDPDPQPEPQPQPDPQPEPQP